MIALISITKIQYSLCVFATLFVLLQGGATPAGVAASAPSDDQQIRDAAILTMDPVAPVDKAIALILVESDLERRFAFEMLKSGEGGAGDVSSRRTGGDGR